MKQIIIKFFMASLFILVGLIIGLSLKKEDVILEKKGNFKTEGSLSMMLETGSGTGVYELTTRSTWPTDGYKFNSKLSKCESGSKVSWDNKNKKVKMEGTSSDKCYIYFSYVPTVKDYCEENQNLADCIKTFGDLGYDTSKIYIHNSSLENGAGDNSYRFAGPSEDVNNFVCFGSDASTCPTDNLYRIIGVFGDQIKLIKYDYVTGNLLGTNGEYADTYKNRGFSLLNYRGKASASNVMTYYWNNVNSNDAYTATGKYNVWSYSALNTINLNTNYINNIGNWAQKIATSTWKVGGNSDANIRTTNVFNVYQNEIVSPVEQTTYSAKIGLMYVSDYVYSASKNYWTYLGYSSQGWSYDYRAAVDFNWMYMGFVEFTITRVSNYDNQTFYIRHSGYIDRATSTSYVTAIRPCFYLNSTVKYVSGKGTEESPIIIN